MGGYIVAGVVLVVAGVALWGGGRIVRWWRGRKADEARQNAARVQVDGQAAFIHREQLRRQARELAEQQADEAARRDAAPGLGQQLRHDVDAAGPRPPHRPGPR